MKKRCISKSSVEAKGLRPVSMVIVVLLILTLNPAPFAFGQIQQGFTYQAIARDVSGSPITNTPLPVMITIQSDSLGGTVFWKELHSYVTTNTFGLLNIIVGKGARQAASTVAKFADIDWSVSPKFIKTEVDNSGWQNMGSSRLWSVPYSMMAGDISGSLKKLTVEGDAPGMEEPLFEVKNKDGKTVFVVYNEGVRIYVADGDAKGVKGGFAIGGIDPSKDEGQEYLRITSDSVRVYIDNSNSKATKGGFAIGGFDGAKADADKFLYITPQYSARGQYNTFTGFQSGHNNKYGRENVFMGYQSGFSTTGNAAGGGDFNVFIGAGSGYSNIGAIFKGGSHNVFIGTESGYANLESAHNTFLGYRSGYSHESGNDNVFMGYQSGFSHASGAGNVYLGSGSGRNCTNGDYNVFIGKNAGYSASGSNLLIIESDISTTNVPLIYGDFTNDRLVINGTSADNSNNRTLCVNGTAGGDAAWYNDSDESLKRDITTITDPLRKVMALRGVNYFWKEPFKGMEGPQMGFIGQEAEKVIPEVVSVDNDRYSMQYAPITALLVEAMKVQQSHIEELRQTVTELQKQVDELKTIMDR